MANEGLGIKKVVYPLLLIVTVGSLGLLIASKITNLGLYAVGSQTMLPLLCVLVIRAICLETKKSYTEFTEEIAKKDPLGKHGIKLQLGSMVVAALSCGASIFLTDTTVRLLLLLTMVLVTVLMLSHLVWGVARDIKKYFRQSMPASPGAIEPKNSE